MTKQTYRIYKNGNFISIARSRKELTEKMNKFKMELGDFSYYKD